MPIERVKRPANKEDRSQNVKTKSDLESSSLVVITNIKLIKLDIFWFLQRQRDFRVA